MKSPADLTIIGAGAAGLAAAIFAADEARRLRISKRIALLDGAKKPGAKILVSGGGRCNVTNVSVTPEDYCGGSRKIIRNILRSFDEKAVIEWMDSLGVPLKLEDTGKYFPVSNQARTVLDALMKQVRDSEIETKFGFRVRSIRQVSTSESLFPCWQITGANGETLWSRRLIIACGGMALPKSGSDGEAFQWMSDLGHTIIPLVPALAPLVLDEQGIEGSPLSTLFSSLAGVSMNARLCFFAGNRCLAESTGSLLFTHFGLSGPAAMNISRHIARHRRDKPDDDRGILRIGAMPFSSNKEADGWLIDQINRHSRSNITTILGEIYPERVAQGLALSCGSIVRMADLSRENRQNLATLCWGSPVAVKGDRGFTFAEATAGGVRLDEINWKTMESRAANGLHLCGEILDVDGRIGGFNFQWAWASGRKAGQSAMQMLQQGS